MLPVSLLKKKVGLHKLVGGSTSPGYNSLLCFHGETKTLSLHVEPVLPSNVVFASDGL